jgi:aspartate oxidase
LNGPLHTDVLILGCGIAGGTAALELADAGLDVLIVTRADRPQESNTYWAQGGIIFRGEGDSPELLAKDIGHAGDGLCHDQAVKILAESGPPLVQSILLDRLAVPFDRRPDGSLALGREGGHSLPRILHSADSTGRAIEDSLIAALASHPRVRFLAGHTAVDRSPRRTTVATGARSTTRCPAWARTCSTSRPARSSVALHVPRCSPLAASGRSSCAPRTRWVRAAMASRWPIAPAHG